MWVSKGMFVGNIVDGKAQVTIYGGGKESVVKAITPPISEGMGGAT